MWGTWQTPTTCNLRNRFIPTHVGNMVFNAPVTTSRAVHPHACGEHEKALCGNGLECGSSPRMWGTFSSMFMFYPCSRFIPTHVGNIRKRSPQKTRRTVHPHACGEHVRRVGQDKLIAGSSPRMWGTCGSDRNRYRGRRFIPTHVGNMPSPNLKSLRRTVHPHACGEHSDVLCLCLISCGSSPRMWGTCPGNLSHFLIPRFIPTHVGNILKLQPFTRPFTVHPHACGEHVSHMQHSHDFFGSSPRMWGTSRNNPEWFCECRFIPTHVGNMYVHGRISYHRAVHPHACGEHSMKSSTNIICKRTDLS